jgi:hypothetical protein
MMAAIEKVMAVATMVKKEKPTISILKTSHPIAN